MAIGPCGFGNARPLRYSGEMARPIRVFAGRFVGWVAVLCVVAAAGRARATSTAEPTGTGSVEKSVVKVFATVRAPDYTQPWNKRAPEELTGSGVIIEGKRILTNAHVVLYA